MDAAPKQTVYGLLAEFADAEALKQAARGTRDAGFTCFDAFSPYPIEDLPRAMGLKRTLVPLLTLVGAAIGGISGYMLQYYPAVIQYPWNVGGKPFHSWPMFVPITFELTILVGGLSAALGMLALNGLPLPYHPLFNAPEFLRASQDRFFLCIEASDPKYQAQQTRDFLQGLGAREVVEVEA